MNKAGLAYFRLGFAVCCAIASGYFYYSHSPGRTIYFALLALIAASWKDPRE